LRADACFSGVESIAGADNVDGAVGSMGALRGLGRAGVLSRYVGGVN